VKCIPVNKPQSNISSGGVSERFGRAKSQVIYMWLKAQWLYGDWLSVAFVVS